MSISIPDLPYTPQIQGWIQQHSPIDVHDRLVQVQFGVTGLRNPDSYTTQSFHTAPRSVTSGTSSMLPTLIHQSHASASTPSLYSSTLRTDASTAEESVSTSLAEQGQLASYRLLDEVDGVLELQLEPSRTPEYQCVFWFLNCAYLSRDREEWQTHCLSHFHCEEPPRSVLCPLCDWEVSCERGFEAWECKMRHLADHHFAFGQGLAASRPDFHLFQYLWQRRLIGDEDLKELKGGNHNLTTPPGNFVTTYGRGARWEREREREGRGIGRQRMQHVSQGFARRS